jgi:hypothetical protein
MTKGIRVAAEGKDALTGATKDLAFTSENQSLKISADFKDIVRTLLIPSAANVTLTIRHDLLYKPVFRLFVEAVPGSGIWYSDSNTLDNFDPATALVWSIIDVNSVTVQVIFVTPGACTIKYKYWLFQDSLD